MYSSIKVNPSLQPRPLAASAKVYDLDYFLRGALAGGICCSITHGAMTPVDVVKTRMQLDPVKYDRTPARATHTPEQAPG
ncbi:hypothetical protein TeGR_g5438 [Tetraparma gracilis]|uniref:Uncharacterized protein n=1 Tax=Tetraparma gracilis TaxID=2962635 RepID=A0ABQ6MSU7_9STRA|nr:hypothetical protein TeGR_g5438 [Tetraparma gracilis]